MGFVRLGKIMDGETGMNQKKIMLVEDSQVIYEMVKEALEAKGFEVSVVTNGFEALRDLDSIHPDLIVTDIMMPKLDGIGLCEAIQNRSETKTIPFIFVSSQFDERTVKRGRAIGARFFIAKPFEMETLVACVSKVLNPEPP
jgi:sigma-B regulation protein RsbU (phosphoserine phosphatase)